MEYIYVDNYRGFSNTLIPIKDVNFLVGENSTGKTSILSVINLFDSPSFWLQQDFNTPEVTLGSFKDLISINSGNEKYFRIGIIDIPSSNQDSQKDEKTQAILMAFISKEGLPLVYEYCFAQENKVIKIHFCDETIKYKVEKLDNEITETGIFDVFNRWIEQGIDDVESFSYFKGKIPFTRREGLGHIGDLIQSILEEKELERHAFSVILPAFSKNLDWIAPIRSKPKRTYDGYKVNFSPEGDHIPHTILRIQKDKKRAIFKEFSNFIDDFGRESGLFETVSVKKFGKATDSPFEVDVLYNGMPFNVSNVGYGVSQVLPVIVELFVKPIGSPYAIQQPEVHLHPKAQAALGDSIFKIASLEKKKLFIETHSDFLIDRFRMNYKSNKEDQVISSQVLFFERVGNSNKIYPIQIGLDGNYSDKQPEAFRSFFIHEELRLFGM